MFSRSDSRQQIKQHKDALGCYNFAHCIGCNGGIGAGAVAGADGETGMFLGREGKGAHWRFVLPAHPLLMHQQLFAPNVIFRPWRSVHAVHPYQSAPKPNFSPSVWQLVHHLFTELFCTKEYFCSLLRIKHPLKAGQ